MYHGIEYHPRNFDNEGGVFVSIKYAMTFYNTVSDKVKECYREIVKNDKKIKRIIEIRRRRDLNPRAAINDLLPFQGSPFSQLGYFSMCLKIIMNIKNGEGGIRTHAPFRTNGFQDRLVMTTSIPLHIKLPATGIEPVRVSLPTGF